MGVFLIEAIAFWVIDFTLASIKFLAEGDQAAVLVGDFLYSRAFQMMVSVGSMRVLEVLADATNVIAEGEVLQLINMHDPDTAVDDYLRVIRYKTAKLFEASARLGAVIAQSPQQLEEACADYGRSLGTAFQLVDDLLDYEGDPHQLGKNVGDDFRDGKITLPVVLAFERGDDTEKKFWQRTLEDGEQAPEDFSRALALMQRHGTLSDSMTRATDYAERARTALQPFPETPAKAAMLDLVDFCIDRIF
ncbi:MAG: octaprenyl diphosphate synthase [Alkalinema sp. RU_4_3]|nr:octaprenyl diphosphate synthase [Alkalinema sp. RU_4_3]